MLIQFISDSPDATSGSALGRGGSGDNIKMCIDAAGTAHLAYTVNQQLTYATGKLGQLILVSTFGGPRLTMEYQWTHHDNVLPSYAPWDYLSQFDLAVDSQGMAHLCFPGTTAGNVQHAVWDVGMSQFTPANILPATYRSVALKGIAMTIAGDDSVHIAFADDKGLHYAKRAANAPSFQQPVDVDTTPGNYFNPSIAVGLGAGSGTTGISYIFQPGGGGNNAQLMFAQQTPTTPWKPELADMGPLQLGPLALSPVDETVAQGTNSLIIDATGTPHIAYCDSASRISHCTRISAGTPLQTEIVDQAGEPSPAKILLDKNGNLFIAYQAAAQGLGTAATMTNVRLATRAMSVWTTATADGSNLSGWALSAAMHPSGVPHIAYGLAQSTGTMFLLRHTWMMDLLLQPPPRRPKKPPVNIPKLPQ